MLRRAPRDRPPAAAARATEQELDKDTQTRIRAERFAGGLGNITPEEKANANVGAGPHKTRKSKGSSKPAQDEPAGRGATR
jgi:hypothetical protein